MVRKFIYFVAVMIVLVIAGGFVLNIYQDELTELAFVPDAEFTEQVALETSIYDENNMWFAGPFSSQSDPTRFRPEKAPGIGSEGPAAIFFVHPTSFISRDRWNAELDDSSTNGRTRTFLRGLASPFAEAGTIWAPKYRQATVGSFLTDKQEGKEALDGAYRDVLLAFDAFLAKQPENKPIILAGHSQGSRHLTYLMQERVKDKPLARRIVAAYIIGWPISLEHDLPEMGLSLCEQPNGINCIITYQSFSEPADYDRILKAYDSSAGLDGQSRAKSQIACTNPLNGGLNEPADLTMNLGTLKPNNDMTAGELIEKAVPARCDEKGFLLIGDPPKIGNYVLPGGNYHVYDIPLFWANLRHDALYRLREYLKR